MGVSSVCHFCSVLDTVMGTVRRCGRRPLIVIVTYVAHADKVRQGEQHSLPRAHAPRFEWQRATTIQQDHLAPVPANISTIYFSDIRRVTRISSLLTSAVYFKKTDFLPFYNGHT